MTMVLVFIALSSRCLHFNFGNHVKNNSVMKSDTLPNPPEELSH